MKLMNKLERKFGKYAIKNLMLYIIGLYALGFFIELLTPNVYTQYLSLNMEMIFKGQIWRLVTFTIAPPQTSSPIFIIFSLYLYYIIGINLERVWGAFRFNFYFFMVVIFQILAALIIYLSTGYSLGLTTYYLNMSLFLAFAAVFPDMQLLLFFIIPIKMKWLGILDGALLLFNVIRYTYFAITVPIHAYSVIYWAMAVSIIVSLLNFIIFFALTRDYNRINPKEIQRKKKFKAETKRENGRLVHKCAVCGRTSEDYPELTFRYCSKCDGNYEYCNEHIFTHEHVKNK